ncbi:MAG TPA: acetyl/propionyl/methylcrotonyl-CoA carboxylase subunit alpha [Pseudomonadales bacterium]|nr:acetyl/propionyl/methylcrotonyl-CoA carboxylase subunit alpha [Pseudomonadales bacterium]
MKHFSTLLIANRGEIACRIIRTAQRMGIRCVAVYSDADKNALHVKLADAAVHIGPAPTRESYLNISQILEAAKLSGAEAIHPGYGFLSENAEFAEACAQAGLIFIGPPASAIIAMGSKSNAKTLMEKADVPLVPGYHGEDQSHATLMQAANNIGYPLLLKAAAGGGGKGMRVVHAQAELEQAIASAQREAQSSFGDAKLLIEKYLTQPRHVEVQVFADQHENCVYLAERDCSLQRRHQKVIEEAPAPGLSETLRQRMGETAVQAARAINYVGAGTIEFLLDSDGEFYFMEMNTRLQVEHPVTEYITGEDLVEWQIRVARGEKLPKQQHEIKLAGHAFEARIYAEDPHNQFLPATGKLQLLQPPTASANVRIDTGVIEGDEISVFYDPMIAKLICYGESRELALANLATALEHYAVAGIKTNTKFLHQLAVHPEFRAANLDTGFIARHLSELTEDEPAFSETELAMLALYRLEEMQAKHAEQSPWQTLGLWSADGSACATVRFSINNHIYQVSLTRHANGFHSQIGGVDTPLRGKLNSGRYTFSAGAHTRTHLLYARENTLYWVRQASTLSVQFDIHEWEVDTQAHGHSSSQSPLNGRITALLAAPKSALKKGEPILTMEAMKMEYTLRAPQNGHVEEFYCAEGDLVSEGKSLFEFTADA